MSAAGETPVGLTVIIIADCYYYYFFLYYLLRVQCKAQFAELGPAAGLQGAAAGAVLRRSPSGGRAQPSPLA